MTLWYCFFYHFNVILSSWYDICSSWYETVMSFHNILIMLNWLKRVELFIDISWCFVLVMTFLCWLIKKNCEVSFLILKLPSWHDFVLLFPFHYILVPVSWHDIVMAFTFLTICFSHVIVIFLLSWRIDAEVLTRLVNFNYVTWHINTFTFLWIYITQKIKLIYSILQIADKEN